MAQVDVQINGRYYAVACDDGQESRVRELAGYIDERVRRLGASGSEPQLLALAGIILADEIFELKNAAATAEARPAELASQTVNESDELVIAAVDHLAERIEGIAARLQAS
jgi:cell division protein ZapA